MTREQKQGDALTLKVSEALWTDMQNGWLTLTEFREAVRRIKTAPELLAACEAVNEAVLDHAAISEFWMTLRLTDAFGQIRAAIANAKRSNAAEK